MCKKMLVLLSVLSLVFSLTACGGNVSNVQRIYGETNSYSKAEVSDAMDIVLDRFNKEFDGCTMITLEYDEEKSDAEKLYWADQYGADQAIVLYSAFDVDHTGGDSGFNPNSTYTDWSWILTRNSNGSWELQSWGY